jgi:hypothetical protein
MMRTDSRCQRGNCQTPPLWEGKVWGTPTRPPRMGCAPRYPALFLKREHPELLQRRKNESSSGELNAEY